MKNQVSNGHTMDYTATADISSGDAVLVGSVLGIAITDMASVLRPHLVIIDGTVGMEGLVFCKGDTWEHVEIDFTALPQAAFHVFYR